MAAVSRDKIPMAPEAEKAVLGAIMLDQRLPDAPIDKSLFYSQSNREILEAIQDIAADDESIDPVQIAERLRQKGRLDSIGVPYIASLTDGAIRSNFDGALRLLIDTAAKRGVWLAASRAAEDSLNGKGSEEIIAELRTKIERISAPAKSRRWPEPQPLPDGRVRAPKLDPEIIPEPLRDWLRDIAHRMQVPLDFAAVPGIVSIATVIGSKVRIRPKQKDDWTVVVNLWGAIIGDPSLLKSPSIEQATRPLRRLIAQAEESHAERMRQFEIEREIDEARRKDVAKQIKAAIADGQDATSLREELGEPLTPPTEKRYLVNDATVEKLGDLLAQNPNGLLLFRDELTGWLRTLDRENNANERAFYLEAWNGGQPYTYDRIGRGTTKIPNTTMSVIGGIQPGPLAAYLEAANAGGAGADGLMQRFQLAVWPDRIARYEHVDEWPDKKAKDVAFNVFQALDAIHPLDERIYCTDDAGYKYLRFDDEAQELFDAWYTRLQHRIRASHLDPAYVSHLAKYGSLFASLALIFHLVEHARSMQPIPDVSFDAAEKALRWIDYLEGHAKKIYGLQAAEAGERVKRLAEKIQSGKVENGFQVRHLQQKRWAGLSKAEEIYEAVNVLVDIGWLEMVQEEGLVRGAKPKTRYMINPKVSKADVSG